MLGKRIGLAVGSVIALVLVAAGCGAPAAPAAPAASAGAAAAGASSAVTATNATKTDATTGTAAAGSGQKIIVGALHVGAITDAGYNQAQHEGLLAMKDALGNVDVIEVENVPESADAERVMESLIQQGATIIFPQSFGYLDPALNVAAKHPNVTFMHPAGFKLAPNLGTYWGNNFEAMYLAGIAAGKATQSNQLGFVTAFPIPNILASVNAFQLGAKSVNPDVTTTLVLNNAWVDPAKEAAAVNALADAGVDVVTGIVDSPVTLVKTAEERGIKSIGFHSKALQQFAPQGWLTGVDYSWGPLFTRIVKSIEDGSWKSEHIRGGIESDFVGLAPYGAGVDAATQQLIADAKAKLVSGDLKIFQGPIKDNTGAVKIPEGQAGGIELLDTTDWLVEGVIGQTK